MRTSTARTSSAGFTLLETLVALAVTALVLSALSGALRRAAAVRERTAVRAERTDAIRTVLLHLGNELEAAVASFEPASPDRFVVVAPEGARSSSELRFATGDGTLIGYRATTGHLLRATASRFAPPSAPEPASVLAGVTRFRVRCLDGAGWHPAWTRPGLPRAVELVLAVAGADGSGEELATTVVLPASDS